MVACDCGAWTANAALPPRANNVPLHRMVTQGGMLGSMRSSARCASPLRVLPSLRPRAAATVSPLRAPLGGPPHAEGQDSCGTLARVIVATAGVSRRLSRAPGLLALQLL